MGDSSKDEEKLPAKTAMRECCKYHWRGKASIIIPIVLSPIIIYGFAKESPEYKCMYIIAVMAFYWITEAIPLYLTALFPVIFFPILGILPSDVVCRLYFTDTLVMFLGGIIIALAIEYSNLHQRIALGTILVVGYSPRRLHFGLVMVTCFISLWISNAAATAMMCPIIKAVLTEMHTQNIFSIFMSEEEEPVEEGDPPHPSILAMAFYFGVAFGATIGGCGTLIGTGTNLTFKGLYDTRFPDIKEKVDFPVFMGYAMPLIVVVNIILVFVSLQFTHMGLFRKNSKVAQEVKKGKENSAVVKEVVKQRYKDLGRISCHELQVALVFLLMIILLFTRKPGFFSGWGDLLKAKAIGSSSPVMICVVLCFALPTNYAFCRYFFRPAPFTSGTMHALLSWTYTHKNTPWGLCFLLGGGFALAEGSKASGMAKMLGDAMGFAENMPAVCVQMMCIAIALLFTAFSSNVAICNILIPIFSEMAIKIHMHPLSLTLPAALACSTAYHLPVSTPPNAIICGYAGIKTKYLAKAGILPTIWAFLLLTLNAATWGKVIYPST